MTLEIGRHGNEAEQNAAHNRHKQKRPKLQTITSLHGLILHGYGPIESIRYEWALYFRRNIGNQSDNMCVIDGVK